MGNDDFQIGNKYDKAYSDMQSNGDGDPKKTKKKSI